MKDILEKFLDSSGLHGKSKEELIKIILHLQKQEQDLMEKYSRLYKSSRERDKENKENIEFYKNKIDEYMRLFAETDVKKEEYKKIVDLKLGNTYDINATWIDKIVFVLKAAGRPLRSSEIIDILSKNDITFRTLANKQKGLSTHLSKALKYGRIIGEKQKGQNGYLFRLAAKNDK